METNYKIPDQTRIGHVHLKVADLKRSLDFYCGVLGFDLITTYGADAAFISAGGYHHHIGLNTWYSKNGPQPARNATGLFHVAILYPTRANLARIVKRLNEKGYPIGGGSDHGVSEAIYLEDPDKNGIELYWDKPHNQWPQKADGSIDMFTRPLDWEGLMHEINQ